MQIPHFVYRLYDATETLIYVGLTGSIAHRMRQHQADKPWWSEVARVEVQQCEDRRAAADLERALIVRHTPCHNVVHMPKAEPAVFGPKFRKGRRKSKNPMTNAFQIRFTPSEKEEIVTDMHAAGFTNMSAYIRFMTLPEELR